jgi:hypothetical protein
MTFAPDSTQAGYLAPTTLSMLGLPFEDFMQEVVAGITGINPTLVRPRWQPQPPTTPAVTVDWIACGVLRTEADWNPAIIHQTDQNGTDLLLMQEHITYIISIYGPHSDDYAGMLRDGLFIEQNRALFRSNGIGLVEVSDIGRVPELFRQQWRDRNDLEVHLNRQVRRVYNVRSLLRSTGTILAQGPGDAEHMVEADWDTDLIPHPTPYQE